MLIQRLRTLQTGRGRGPARGLAYHAPRKMGKSALSRTASPTNPVENLHTHARTREGRTHMQGSWKVARSPRYYQSWMCVFPNEDRGGSIEDAVELRGQAMVSKCSRHPMLPVPHRVLRLLWIRRELIQWTLRHDSRRRVAGLKHSQPEICKKSRAPRHLQPRAVVDRVSEQSPIGAEGVARRELLAVHTMKTQHHGAFT
jgi:hypothetical protein